MADQAASSECRKRILVRDGKAVGVALAAYLLYELRLLLILVFLAILLSAGLYGVARFLERFLPRILAVFVTYALLVGLFVLVLFLIFPPLVRQVMTSPRRARPARRRPRRRRRPVARRGRPRRPGAAEIPPRARRSASSGCRSGSSPSTRARRTAPRFASRSGGPATTSWPRRSPG
jgi:hypothetical protein